jgi:hypothetical protein
VWATNNASLNCNAALTAQPQAMRVNVVDHAAISPFRPPWKTRLPLGDSIKY